MEHAFNTNVAAKYDLNIATLLQNFRFWTRDNLANKRHLHEGLCWTYNTVQAFCEIFPYWTRHQIEHLLKKAELLGLIVAGNFNQNKYDRTKWYALTPNTYQYFEDLQLESFIERLYLSISANDQKIKTLNLCISENSEMEFGDFRNRFLKFPKPIPDTDPDTDPNTKNNIGTSGEVPKVDYTELDVQPDEKNRSDYLSNQQPHNKDTTQVSDSKIDSTKSDYFENHPIKKTPRSNREIYGLKEITNNNPFQIPEEIIQDWITNRQKKKVAVTKTAWNKINKELAKCDDPIAAFEEMVAAGWQSFKADWIKASNSYSKKSFFDHESTKWAEGIEQDMF